MSDEEVNEFLLEPFAEQAIALRRWDDEGKVEELSSGSVRDYEASMTAAVNAKTSPVSIDEVQQADFRNKGYLVLPAALSAADMDALEAENKRLNAHAQRLLNQLAESGESLADFYKRQQAELIVVPEIDDPAKVCRFEYIDASSKLIHQQVLPKLQS